MTLRIIERPSPNFSTRNKGVRVDTVLLHHTGGTSASGDLSWLRNPKSQASAHYLVHPDGGVYRIVPEDRTAWHAGLSRLPWEPWRKGGSVNAQSIGIEVVNPGDGKRPFTEAQYTALAELVPDVCSRLKAETILVRPHPKELMPGSDRRVYVFGHRDVACFEDGRFGRKTDPADNFDWGRIRKALGGAS